MDKKFMALMAVIVITHALSVKNNGLDILNGTTLLTSVAALIAVAKHGR